MEYYYEVKHLGKWSARATIYKPNIRRELKVYHTEPKKISEAHKEKTLQELSDIYGTHCKSVEFKSSRNS